MPSPIRIDIPGVVYEETYRCRQSRFLLLPEEELNDLILGAIGRGLQMFPNVRLHDFVHLSNHGHRLVSSTDGVSRSRFTQYVSQRISKEAGRRFGWEGGIFARPARPIPCITHEDQLARFSYLRSHGIKEDLVEKVEDLPGASALPFLRHGMPLEGTFVWRDAETKALRRATEPVDLSPFRETYAVTLTKLPALEERSWEEIHEYTDVLTKKLEDECARKRTGRVLGRAGILAQHPHGSPKKSKKSSAPIAHCKDKGLRSSFKRLSRCLTAALRGANRAIRDGKSYVDFPPFCYPARLPYVSWAAATKRHEGMTAGVEEASALVSFAAGAGAVDKQRPKKANAPPTLLEILCDDLRFAEP